MTGQEIMAFAESLEGAKCDFPFEGDFVTYVMRHGAGGRWFGIFMEAPPASLMRGCGGKQEELERLFGNNERIEILNLKCEPALSCILQHNFTGVLPAYHMNKRLWISVVLKSDVPDEQLKGLIELSYGLTSKGGKSFERRL